MLINFNYFQNFNTVIETASNETDFEYRDCSKSNKRGPYGKKYSAEDLQDALDEIRSGSLSVYGASSKFNIPKQTLNDKIKGKHTKKPGSEQILSNELEDRLAAHISFNAEFGTPLTKTQILKIAGEMANLNPDPAKHFKNGAPSSAWLKGFKKRHSPSSPRTKRLRFSQTRKSALMFTTPFVPSRRHQGSCQRSQANSTMKTQLDSSTNIAYSDKSVEEDIEKLVDNISDTVKQLGALLTVHDPVKLLNVLVIRQNLNIIKYNSIVISDDENQDEN